MVKVKRLTVNFTVVFKTLLLRSWTLNINHSLSSMGAQGVGLALSEPFSLQSISSLLLAFKQIIMTGWTGGLF